MRTRLCVLLASVVTAACAVVGGVPSEFDSVPRIDERLEAGMQQLDVKRPLAALAIAESVLAEQPDSVEAARLRQDVLRDRGRLGLLRAEAERRLAENPRDARALYLAGRIAPRPRQPDYFAAAIAAAPNDFWGWFGLAFTMQRDDVDRSLAIYRALYAATDGMPLVARPYGRSCLMAERYDEAERVFVAMREAKPDDGEADWFLGELALARNQPLAAYGHILLALRRRPHDPALRATAERLVTTFFGHGNDDVLDVVLADAERLQAFVDAGGRSLLAALLVRKGMVAAARSVLALPGPPRTAGERRLWRRLLMQTGAVAQALADLRDGFPAELLADEGNRIASVWRSLFEGPWMQHRDPTTDPAVAAALARALLRCGLVDEAEIVCAVAALHRDAVSHVGTNGVPPDGRAELDAVGAEARRHLAFERALQRHLRVLAASRKADALHAFFELARASSVELLGRDVVGKPRRFSIPLIGELLDPLAPGLGEYFASYNRYFVVGQRGGRSLDALLLTRLSVRDVTPHPLLPLPTRCTEIVGEARQSRVGGDGLGGDLAGVALFHHYLVDYDAVRDWADGLRSRRRILREDGEVAMRDPLPQRVDADDPLDASWRLPMLDPTPDAALEAAVLDMIRWHEQAHLVDAFWYLPPERNLWRVLGLLIRHGFGALGIESDFERRAETAALALSPHTRLVLAHIATFLEGDAGGSPHAHGFRDLARQITAAARERGLPGAEPHQWHLLDAAQAREIGVELLRRLW